MHDVRILYCVIDDLLVILCKRDVVFIKYTVYQSSHIRDGKNIIAFKTSSVCVGTDDLDIVTFFFERANKIESGNGCSVVCLAKNLAYDSNVHFDLRFYVIRFADAIMLAQNDTKFNLLTRDAPISPTLLTVEKEKRLQRQENS